MALKLNHLVYGIALLTTAGTMYAVKRAFDSSKVYTVTVTRGDERVVYELTYRRDGMMTLVLISTVPEGFGTLFHNHLVAAVHHSNFNSLDQLCNFIRATDKRLNVDLKEV